MGRDFWYVYLLQSLSNAGRHYVGLTNNLRVRLDRHNSGLVPHTSKFVPWRVEIAIAFRSKGKAVAFEKYLKSHSGRAFAAKHL